MVRGVRRGVAPSAAALVVLAVAAATARTADGEARVSLDLRDAPVVDVVRVLAEAASLQPVFDPGITCRLTLKLHAARWRPALDAALSTCSLGSESEGDILRVAPLSRLREEAAARRQLDEERRSRPAGRLELVRLSYARAEQVAPLLDKLLAGQGRVSYDARTNTLVVRY